jgi:hypothetical protein
LGDRPFDIADRNATCCHTYQKKYAFWSRERAVGLHSIVIVEGRTMVGNGRYLVVEKSGISRNA